MPAGLLYSTLELFTTCGVVITIAITLPKFLLAGALVLLAYIPLGWAYIAASREVKRIGGHDSASSAEPTLTLNIQILLPGLLTILSSERLWLASLAFERTAIQRASLPNFSLH